MISPSSCGGSVSIQTVNAREIIPRAITQWCKLEEPCSRSTRRRSPHEGEGALRRCRREPHDDTRKLVRHRCVLATTSCTLRQRAGRRIQPLIPLAPAATLLERFPENLRDMLNNLDVNPAFIAAERWATNRLFAKTANRQVLGLMNRFEFELEYVRERYSGNDLMQLSLWQSDTLAGPLRGGTRTPREELLELVEQKSI